MTQQRLYMKRNCLNAEDIRIWAKSVGFYTAVLPEFLHVTLMFSRNAVNHDDFYLYDDVIEIPEDEDRQIASFGRSVSLVFQNHQLKIRNTDIRKLGAKEKFSYCPHIAITYSKPFSMRVDKVKPYFGPIVLGPEIKMPLDPLFMPKESRL